ncbi:beta-ketoacyl-ACP reductase [Cetobacterium sp. 2A]|uniref:beta-ketoacyl-ACP reductase n=1 Tax=unclassified Cetobacterium TaxID=2630983 RepID=UPI00163C782D|nr:beta-ketoacyl-ACP reductase [Cetobacterium sp. 2A]MBC2857264.1 beta-ketoacyl-ACP reductase [Cetobacterium sp. 2A]
MKLEGKIAVVTGGARGIGAEICNKLAEQGAIVYSCDLGVGEFQNDNIKSEILNVVDREGVANLVQKIKEKYGKVDILVNNAGITKDALIQKMTEEAWDAVIDVNLKGVFNLTQAIAPIMMENGIGSIINLSSVVGVYGNIGQTNYVATKAGVIGLTKAWAKEFARKGAKVRTNAIAPGFIKTPMTVDLPEKVIAGMIEKTPLKRLGESEDIANAVVFLASDDSSFITGQTLGVDGGLTI